MLCRLSYPRSIEIEGTGWRGLRATYMTFPGAGDGVGSLAGIASAPVVLVPVETVSDLRTVFDTIADVAGATEQLTLGCFCDQFSPCP
jgi:hypothetical protein